MIKKNALWMLLIICTFSLRAQTPTIAVGGYVDAYFANDDDKGTDELNGGNRLFSYVNPTKNRFSINTAQITAKIGVENVFRSNITLHMGDLHKTAWEAADVSMPFIQQANAGVRVAENIWIDGGIFLTHIGGESLLPKDNWLSTHSLVTYYEPFYQAGVRASYESEKFTAQLHVLNGNGIIDENNYNKTFGWFFSYTPSTVFSVSYAGVAGNEVPGNPKFASSQALHNLVFQVNPFDKFSLKGQLDLGMKKVPDAENGGAMKSRLFSGYSLTAHYAFTDQFSASGRYAFVDNAYAVFEPAVEGMETTLGFEYKPHANAYVRLEGRNISLGDDYKLFGSTADLASTRKELILNFGVWFN